MQQNFCAVLQIQSFYTVIRLWPTFFITSLISSTNDIPVYTLLVPSSKTRSNFYHRSVINTNVWPQGKQWKFRETLNVEGSGGNKTNCFPWGQSLSVLLYLPTQNRKNCEKNIFAWRRLTSKFAAVSRCTTSSRGSRKSKLLFPWGVKDFCSPRGVTAVLTFDPWHLTRSPPVGKRIWVGRYNNFPCLTH